MVFVKKNKINGKEYSYFSKSIRLPNGSIKTIRKYAPKTASARPDKEWFYAQETKAFGDWAVKTYKTDLVFSEAQLRGIEEMRLGYKHILRSLSKPQLKDLFDRFTVNFTYESNAIEGSSLTLKDVAIILLEKIVVKGKNLREIYETINSRKVVDLILRKKFKVSEKDIIKMHRLLVRNMDIQTGYKKIPNYIIGRTIETTEPRNVAREMRALIAFYAKNRGRLHPIQLAALMHGKFERIHPFDDGNGRVGRFLINAVLVNDHYPPLIIRKTQRIAYLKCLEDYDNGYTANLERFLLEKFKDTYKKFFEVYVKYVK